MMHSPRPMGSSPGTPVSGAPLTSPVPGSKNSPGSNPSNPGPNAQSDGMFPGGRQMPNFPKGQQSSNKEANLMPVPSPQQIQYLNPLEGQELTIQKQPNTSLRESDLLSPPVTGTPMDQNKMDPSASGPTQGGPPPMAGGPPTPSGGPQGGGGGGGGGPQTP